MHNSKYLLLPFFFFTIILLAQLTVAGTTQQIILGQDDDSTFFNGPRGPAGPQGPIGPAGTNGSGGGAENLSQLNDTNISAPIFTGQVLTYNITTGFWGNKNSTGASGNVSLTNVAFTNQSNNFTDNQTTNGWWNGLFNWTTLTNWLSFDGTTLSFNETKLNFTGDQRYVNIDGDNMTGNLNVSGNITAEYYLGDGSQLTNLPAGGNLSWNQSLADTLYANITWAYNQTTPAINYSNNNFLRNDGDNATGEYNFDGHWTDGGITINNGELFVNTLYAYNFSSLVVSNINTNGSLIPSFGNTFDIGNDSKRWRNIYVGADIFITGVGGVKQWLYNQTIPSLAYTDQQINLINTTENIEALNFTQGPHTVDTNAETECSGPNVLLGNGTCIPAIINPFNQSLNTSDNVTFNNVNVTSTLRVGVGDIFETGGSLIFR